MTVVMITRRLWQALGGKGALQKHERRAPEDGARLGSWSASFVQHEAGDFLVALNETTYLTVVGPFVGLHSLRECIAVGAEAMLQRWGVPDDQVAHEVRALLRADIGANTNRSLTGSVNDVCGHVAWYLDGRPTPGLLQVMIELNQMPHVMREDPFPDRATMRLFEVVVH